MVEGLGRRVVRGVVWKLASQMLQLVMRLGTSVVLARLVAPRDFGLAAMAFVFSGVVVLLNDLALGTALVQRETLDERDRSTVFWTSAALGAALTGVGIAVAGPIANFYGQPAVRPLFMVLSATFVLNGLSSTQASLLTRELDFRGLETRQMCATLAGAAMGIALAVAGYGPWALIAQATASSAASLVMLWTVSSWRPSLTFSAASFRDLGAFGSKVFVARLFSWTTSNADNLLIGRFVGSAALGAYSLAFNTMLTPIERLATPLQQVLYPAFARLQDRPRKLADEWLRGLRLLGTILVPTFLGLAILTPDLVPTVFGPRWHAAVPVLWLLSLSGTVQVFALLTPAILQARGRPGVQTLLSGASCVITVAGFAVGLHWGIVGVAVSFTISRFVMLPAYVSATARVAEVRLREIVVATRGLWLAAVIMALGVEGARLVLIHAAATASVRLAALPVIGLALYVPLFTWLDPSTAGDIRGIVAQLRRRRGPVAALAVGSAR